MNYEIKREIRSKTGAWLDSETVHECESASSREAIIEWAEMNGYSRWENDTDLDVLHDVESDRAAMHLGGENGTMIYHARRSDDPTF